MIKPTMEEARLLARNNKMVPISLEMFADVKTPIEILKTIRAKSDNWYILESVNGGDNWGRYSFLGYNPTTAISGTSGIITIKNGASKSVVIEDAVNSLAECLPRFQRRSALGL